MKRDQGPRPCEKERLQVSAALIFNQDKILITSCRAGTRWEFPGGKLEPGETPENCVVREIKEELGLDINVLRYFMGVDHEDDEISFTLHTFICQIKFGEPLCTPGETYIWAGVADLEQYDFLPADRLIIQALSSKDYDFSGSAEEKQ